MDEIRNYTGLVQRAQLGDTECLNRLAELVRGRLYAYTLRIVLHEDLAQDIVQESMTEMVKILGKLEKADRFWPWLRGIAFNKIRRHFSKEKRHQAVSMTDFVSEDYLHDKQEGQEGLAEVVSQ